MVKQKLSRQLFWAGIVAFQACAPPESAPPLDAGLDTQACQGTECPQKVDCDWFFQSSCYRTGLSEAAACVPPQTAQGTLSSDGKVCVYDDGFVVTFAQPPPLFASIRSPIDFSMSSNGQPCLRFEEMDGVTKLTTRSGTSILEFTSSGRALTCPDMHSYTANCSLGRPIWTATAGSDSATLKLGMGNYELMLYQCTR